MARAVGAGGNGARPMGASAAEARAQRPIVRRRRQSRQQSRRPRAAPPRLAPPTAPQHRPPPEDPKGARDGGGAARAGRQGAEQARAPARCQVRRPELAASTLARRQHALAAQPPEPPSTGFCRRARGCARNIPHLGLPARPAPPGSPAAEARPTLRWRRAACARERNWRLIHMNKILK
eukprot:scaffold32223_cov107-Isochrysis_galbana.AAC.3